MQTKKATTFVRFQQSWQVSGSCQPRTWEGTVPYVQWFTPRDGKIACLDAYYDPRSFFLQEAGSLGVRR